MSDTERNSPEDGGEEQYEKVKSSYEVLNAYSLPSWYLKHVWVWPMVVAWLAIVICSAPGHKLDSALIWGGIIVAMDVCMMLVAKFWPI